jgi:hypothetical protein
VCCSILFNAACHTQLLCYPQLLLLMLRLSVHADTALTGIVAAAAAARTAVAVTQTAAAAAAAAVLCSGL